MTKEVSFRSADESDAPLVARFLRELAEYEKLTATTLINEEELAKHLSPKTAPQLYAIIAECDGIAVGMAIYFMRYSTFTTSWGLHLEDLYVIESYRNRGLGRAFFVVLARLAKKHGYTRIDFNVLDWNQPARSMYEGLGAFAQSEWVAMRLEGKTLLLLATHPELQAIQVKTWQ